jgi:transposase-like protein
VAYPTLPRDLIKRGENENFPLIGLSALRELRTALDQLEAAAILRAREMGASTSDIGEALGLTRQAAYYRIRQLLERRAAAESGDIIVVPDTQPADPRA